MLPNSIIDFALELSNLAAILLKPQSDISRETGKCLRSSRLPVPQC